LGKQIYFTDDQLEYLRLTMDPNNAQEDVAMDAIRQEIHEKLNDQVNRKI
jgi:hypothetical protein